MGALIIVVVAGLLVWRFTKGFWYGLTWSVALLVSLPKQIQIPLGALPALTVHRLIVLLLLTYSFKEIRTRPQGGKLPFGALLVWILVTQALSALFAEDKVSAVKAFLYYALENVMYFVILTKVVRDRNDALRLVPAICAGLLGVGILAFIEKYKGYSPMQYFPGYYEGTVMATFSHRILLGTAMAMGWPLCLFWAAVATTRKQRILAWVTAGLCIGSCYFAQSRGPWMGMVLVAILLGVLGTFRQRKRLLVIGALAVLVIASNQGVQQTIMARIGSTFDTESEAAVSYQWRWELWHKAWMEINRSAVRLFCGYGPGASEALNWEGVVTSSALSDFTTDTFSSWDNNWAAYMLECGLLGFGVLLGFYVLVVRRLLLVWRATTGTERDLAVFLIGALAVFIFMQTNVQIFAPQLYFLFWTTLASAVALERSPAWRGQGETGA